MNNVFVAAVMSTALMASGCGTEEGAGLDDAAMTQDEGARILFQAAYSKTGHLRVVEDEGGNLGVAVQGRIGVDDAELARMAMAQQTLVETYRLLNPDATSVPETVRALSDTLQNQREAALAKLPAEELVRREDTRVHAQDFAGFYSKACQTIGGGFEGWSPEYCSYQYNWHSICSYSTIGTGDRSYGWNESPYTAKQSLSGMTWKPTLPAWTFQWAEWSGTYSNRYACVTLDGTNTYGNLGVTHHDYFTDNVGNPI